MARLSESVETVTRSGEHYQLSEATTLRAAQDRIPILVGVYGRSALAHAARHAHTIGLTMLRRAHPDGQNHRVRWDPNASTPWIALHADERAANVELNALIRAVVVTNDRREAAGRLAKKIPGLAPHDALAIPFLALGTHDEIANHLLACRARWGISYCVVRNIDTFAPVIERLRHIQSR